MKKTTKVLRTILLLVGIVLFVFATVGESVERANWNAIQDFVEDLAEEQKRLKQRHPANRGRKHR